MAREGLLVGEVASRSGASRKALRLYEALGILPAPRRTAAGYRVFGSDVLALLAFVRQARSLGFSLEEIKEIVAIKRSGQIPCQHVQDLVRRKELALNRMLSDLTNVRDNLRRLLKSRRRKRVGQAVICPHIELADKRRKRDGTTHDVPVPGVRRVPGSRDHRRRSADRRAG